MKAKLLFTLICAIMCMLALTLVTSAQEYTVSDSAGFKAAFAGAADGDTIVIKGDIEADLNFGKSITYIIDGGYTWLAGAAAPEDGHDVRVYARNGDAVFKPNTGMWMNSYESDVTSVSQTTWSMGSLDDSTLVFDMTKTNIRLVYNLRFKEINFESGLVVTNCNNNDMRDTKYFVATTINIHEDVEIFGIYVAPYRGFFDCTTLNIYGGEIHGCYFGEYGMALAKTVNMYGGKIHDIYLNFTNSGVTEGLFNNAALNMYGGEIYNNYVKISSAGAHSVLAGAKHLVGGSVHDNYTFTGWGSTPALNGNGLYEIAGLDLSTGTDAGYGKNATTVYDYSLVFKDSQGSLISAYLVKSGAIKSTISGATEVLVPEGYSFTTVRGTCAEVKPDLTVGGTYYAVRHTFSADDFDCTTAKSCLACPYTEAARSHVVIEAVSFVSGYDKSGAYVSYCANEGCLACDEERALGAVIVSLGYSVSEPETGFCSITQGFLINGESMELVNRLTNEKIVDFGVVVASKNSLGGVTDVFENGLVSVDRGVIAYSMANSKYDYIYVKLTGLENKTENGNFTDIEVFVGAYLTFAKGEEKNTLYVDQQGVTEELAHFVTYSSFFTAE